MTAPIQPGATDTPPGAGWWLTVRTQGPQLVVVIATLVALVLGLYQIDRRSFWLDEATTYYISGVGWRRLGEIFLGAVHGWHPPAYFVALKAWRSVAGDDEAALRAFSTVFAMASVPMLFLVARRLTGAWTAGLAAALLGVNAFAVHYAQEARTYSLTMFLAIASYWLLLRAGESGRIRAWIAYALVAVLGVYSHLFFGLVVVAQAGALLVPGRRPRAWRGPVIGFGTVALLSAPLALGAVLGAGDVLNWIPPMEWDAFRRLLRAFSGGTIATLVMYGLGCLLAVAWIIGPGRSWRWTPLVLLWVLVPVLGLAALSLVKPVFLPRYLIVSLPALVLLVAVGAGMLPRWAALSVAALLLVTSAFAVGNWYASAHTQWREVAAHLDGHGTPDDGVVLWQQNYRRPLAYQMSLREPIDELPRLVTPPIRWDGHFYSRGIPRTSAARQLTRCEFERVWLVGGDRDPPPDRDASTRILSAAYDHEQTTRFQRITLHLFVRNAAPCS